MGITKFAVHGPYEVPYLNDSGGLRRVVERCPEFWGACSDLESRKGCYVFGLRWGSKVHVMYVGMTAKQDFRSECFTRHKVTEHYNPSLRRRVRGRPVMLLLVAPKVKTPKNRIGDLETFLIQTLVANGVKLTNKRKRGHKAWNISGVLPPTRGQPSPAARSLRAALQI